MKFDFCIGNPPYQESQESTSDSPVYDSFMDAAYSVAEKVELITPARFLFDAGKTPSKWNKKMLSDDHLKVSFYEQDSRKVFANTEIKGGIAVTYRDASQKFGAINHFIPNNTLRDILYKVSDYSLNASLSELVNPTEYFKIDKKLYEDFPEILETMIEIKGKPVPLVSKGHESDLTSNIMDKNPKLFFEKKPCDGKDYYRVFGRQNGKRVFRYFCTKYLQENDGLRKYKIILPESNNDGTFGETLVNPFVADKDVATTQSFITIGFFDTKSETEAALKYICTKFARTLLGTMKITQHNKKETWRNVPLQDFTSASDIDWTKAIKEIDQQLYKKYNLSVEEINFIETNVKEMG